MLPAERRENSPRSAVAVTAPRRRTAPRYGGGVKSRTENEKPLMLSLRQRLALVNLYKELGSYRAVAALIGCDHKTVKAWLQRERTGETAPKPRPRLTDPHLPLIRSKVAATEGKIRRRPLLQIVRAAGCQVSPRTLQRTLREVRQEWAREHRRLYRPWVSAPGEFLMVDWGDGDA